MAQILAINTGLNASAGLFQDGKPVFCIQEERLCREKNFGGFPKLSLEYIFEYVSQPSNIDDVVFTNSHPEVISKSDYINKYHNAFRDASRKSHELSLLKVLKRRVRNSFLFGLLKTQKNVPADDKSWLISKGLSADQFHYFDHHLCHAGAAYFGLAEKLDEPYLVFTLDGGGDDYTSKVYSARNGELIPICSSQSYSIGNIYSAVTYFLGFTPHEHEYKLMGLAPYVNPRYAEKYRQFFHRFIHLENGNFANPEFNRHSLFMSELLDEFKASRFDNIAAGLQMFTEDLITEWVKFNVDKLGIRKILCSGGVFMNVKANQRLAELDGIDFINVFPSCGDETNIFGAAFLRHNQSSKTKSIRLIQEFTLGPIPSSDLDSAIEKYKPKLRYERLKEPAKKVAKLLADNKIIARCSGKMEFGARALGNRSILANPTNLSNVSIINRAVKKRDFWMPFAPAILEEDLAEYFKVPSSLSKTKSPYMMFSFNSELENRQKIICGLHQGDHTGRVQTVNKEYNKGFYDLIKEFKNITGIPVVLNTSFNLHGYPIVTSSEEAIHVLLNSEIDYLIIEDTLISRA